MGKLREQLHEETIKLEMAHWIKERNLKPNVPKNELEGIKKDGSSEISPF